MAKQTATFQPLQCTVLGVGAWGPGFNTWPELDAILRSESTAQALPEAIKPKPMLIPANERRRAPLPVKAAVEVSAQALTQSGLSATDVACVFGSGLGDTEITDYMCRVLASADQQLSPTKFHNSVHNAAAGYWTISTDCMKSANSIAGYDHTAGLALLEGVTQCTFQQEPVLITVFDTATSEGYRDIFPCRHSFAAAIVIAPSNATGLAQMTLTQANHPESTPALRNPALENLRSENPAAQFLPVLNALAELQEQSQKCVQLGISEHTGITIQLRTTK